MALTTLKSALKENLTATKIRLRVVVLVEVERDAVVEVVTTLDSVENAGLVTVGGTSVGRVTVAVVDGGTSVGLVTVGGTSVGRVTVAVVDGGTSVGLVTVAVVDGGTSVGLVTVGRTVEGVPTCQL